LRIDVRIQALAYVAATLLVLKRNAYRWRRDWDRATAERGRPKPPLPELECTPLVSILALAWNETDNPRALIQSFLDLDYANKELILGVGGAHDLGELGRPPPGVVLLEHPGGGKMPGMGACYAKARGEIIYLTDGDTLLSTDAFVRLIAPIANEEERVTSGRWGALPEQRDQPLVALQWAIRVRGAPDQPYAKENLSGACTVFDRTTLDAIGAMDYEAPIGEDRHRSILLRRAGIRHRHVAEAITPMHFHGNVRDYVRQQARNVRTDLVMALAPGEAGHGLKTVRRSAESFATLGLTALALLNGPARLLLYTRLLSEYVPQLRRVVFACRRGDVPWRNVYVPWLLAKLYLDHIAAARGSLELPFRGQRYRW
jgi:cellulose synthase/poly-beta-1,6-N-acetylglucosamine synthase-like glycosyltransferase